MKIERAMVCLDCDEVFDGRDYKRCPSCTSRSVEPLHRWIGVSTRFITPTDLVLKGSTAVPANAGGM